MSAVADLFKPTASRVDGRNERSAARIDFADAPNPEELWRSGTVDAADLADALADHHRLGRLSFQDVIVHPPLLGDLSRRYLRDAYIYPFERNGVVSVALADPSRLDAIKAVQLALGVSPALHVLSFEEVDLLFERATVQRESDADSQTLVASADVDQLIGTVESLQDLAQGAPIVRLIDQILERAVELGATDVHLETERDQLSVRLRIDGYLRRDQKIPLAQAPAIISRVKILAGLDIADRRMPQDGRANLRIGKAEADLRVAVMPTIHGETAVLRVLLRDTKLLDLTRIGMGQKDRARFEALLAEPHGIVVVTGPTGSGKTTTLATAIGLLNSPARKIVTVEDPIEYQIAGVHQTQLKPSIGLTFATALRSFLRHDPDIIMVGEMRDPETASIGIQAALTGHLVLTTLHTNSASDAVARLVDMGVEPYLLGASLRGIVGQRLVRKLCDRCKAPDEAASQTAARVAATRGIAFGPGSVVHGPRGCEACGHTGYRSRVGIFEVLRIDDTLRDIVRQEPDAQVIAASARKSGMTLMIEDGLAKCASGLTSIEEVLRATG